MLLRMLKCLNKFGFCWNLIIDLYVYQNISTNQEIYFVNAKHSKIKRIINGLDPFTPYFGRSFDIPNILDLFPNIRGSLHTLRHFQNPFLLLTTALETQKVDIVWASSELIQNTQCVWSLHLHRSAMYIRNLIRDIDFDFASIAPAAKNISIGGGFLWFEVEGINFANILSFKRLERQFFTFLVFPFWQSLGPLDKFLPYGLKMHGFLRRESIRRARWRAGGWWGLLRR